MEHAFTKIEDLRPREWDVIETCPDHGEFTNKVYVASGRRVALGCPKCDAERAERRKREADEGDAVELRFDQRRAAKANALRLKASISQAAIPPRFASKTFGTFEGESQQASRVKAYADSFAANLEQGRCLILSGGIGLGKTHLVSALLNQIIGDGFSGVYFTANDVIRFVQEGYHTGQSGKKLNDLAAWNLLVIDEFGCQKTTDDSVNIMSEIIDKRYQLMRPTVIVTNLSAVRGGEPSPLELVLGEKSFDRLRDGGGSLIPFTGESFRGRS